MSELEDTVREMLRSETFEPDELRDVLVERGHDRADVERAIAEMQRTLAERSDSPAEVAARKRARRGGRMIRAGLMIAAVGLVYVVLAGGGILLAWVVVGAGASLIAAGYRHARS